MLGDTENGYSQGLYIAMAFLKQGPAQITFHASSWENAQGTINFLNANGYRSGYDGHYELMARVAGNWCRLCHRRIKHGRLCSGCEWIAAVHGFPNAFGLCATDGERLLLHCAGWEPARRSQGYVIQTTTEADEKMIERMQATRQGCTGCAGQSGCTDEPDCALRDDRVVPAAPDEPDSAPRAATQEMRLCAYCGSPIKSEDRRRKYCQPTCAKSARAEKMRKINRDAYDRRRRTAPQ